MCWRVWLCVCQVSADWERASLRPGSQPSSVFKPSPVMGTYATDGGFINTTLVAADEESQEFDDLIFALKTGEDPDSTRMYLIHQQHTQKEHTNYHIRTITLLIKTLLSCTLPWNMKIKGMWVLIYPCVHPPQPSVVISLQTLNLSAAMETILSQPLLMINELKTHWCISQHTHTPHWNHRV